MSAFSRLKNALAQLNPAPAPDAPARHLAGAGDFFERHEPYVTPRGILRWRSITPPAPSGLNDFIDALAIAREAGKHGEINQCRCERTNDDRWILRDLKRRVIAVVDMTSRSLVEHE